MFTEEVHAVLRDEPDGIYLFADRNDAVEFAQKQGGILSAEPIMSGDHARAVIDPDYNPNERS